MKTLAVHGTEAELSISLDELDLLRNGLNEARLAVKGEADFETRLGVTRDDASAMIQNLIAAMEAIIKNRERESTATPRRAAGN